MAQPPDPPAPVSTPTVPGWVIILGAIFGGLTLVFFMVLVLGGIPISRGNHFLICIIFALGCGLSASFLGGAAAASGNIPLPYVKTHPIQFSVGGGIAVIVIVLLLCYYLMPPVTPPAVLQIEGQPEVNVSGKGNALLHVRYSIDGWDATKRLVVQVSKDKEMSDILQETTLNDPNIGHAEINLGRQPPDTILWFRLVLKDRHGSQLATTMAKQIVVPK